MELNGYKLSQRAALAAMGYQVETPPAEMTINAQAVAKARMVTGSAGKGPSPMALDAKAVFAPYKFPSATYPDGIAEDSCLPMPYAGVSSWAIDTLYHEGQGFFGYPYLAQLVQRAEYRQAVDIWAEHAVRKWIKITGGTGEQRKAVEKEFVRLNVRDVFQEWITHDETFGRGQIFLDFGDADNTPELATELRIDPGKISPERPLQRLKVVEPMWSAPGAYATNNPLAEDFYKPVHWFVYGRRVHSSRFLTIVSRPVSDMLKPSYAFGGQSLVQIMKPYVDNWLRTRQSVSDLINAFSIINLATDMSSTMNNGNGDSLFNRIDMFNLTRDNRGTMVTDKNAEELNNLAVPLNGLDKLQAQAQEQMASAARIPLSVFLQITPTGLNATNDGETRNFYADVKSYQEKNVRPGLQAVFLIAQLSVLGQIVEGMAFEFEPLWEMNDKDKADIRKADADADVGYVTAGIVSADEARERLSNDETSLYHGVDLTDAAPEIPGQEEDAEDVNASEESGD